ncbi:unnamed protein product [Acanthoscelides obtectus]|uniref:Uncharacterized protein n=1 Tax=Acanthoscelides obtectus TaxID=200917 RepID=A0A9P0KWJ8_ACAOB|nr:unnamed protein product [Acanthoscelides obtectus]CAK1645277.1 Neural cell adhesion molecule 2 [Acanthoscelides obtectus]
MYLSYYLSSSAKHSSAPPTEENNAINHIFLSQESATVRPGRTLAIACKAQGHVQWRSPSGAKLGPRTRPVVREFIAMGKVLIFNDTRAADAGNYTCVANGTQKVFSLTVAEALHCKHCQEVQTGKEGQTITLKCGLKCGEDEGSVIWNVVENENYIELLPPKYQRVTDDLKISNLRPKDARKEYVCLVPGKLGEIQNCRIRLKVQHKPYFKEELRREELPNRTLGSTSSGKLYVADNEIYIEDGELVNLTCEVQAEPGAKFDWFAVDRNNRTKKLGNALTVNGTLSILEVRKSDAASESYKCMAWNPHGRLEKSFNLHLGFRPDPPLSLDLVNATSDSLELKLDVEEDIEALPAVLFIMYRKVDSDQWEELETNVNNGSVVLENLDAGTKYGIKAAMRNIVGLSNFTDFVFFQTLPSSASSTASILSVVIFLSVLHTLHTVGVVS